MINQSEALLGEIHGQHDGDCRLQNADILEMDARLKNKNCSSSLRAFRISF